MVEDDLDEFRMWMMEMTECYPNQRFSDGSVRSYFRKLMKFPLAVVLRSLHKAVDEHPDRMPTAGQLAAMCKSGSSTAARDTVELLKRTYGDDYYAKDYAQGVREGINRPVREVLADDSARGWRDRSELDRWDREHQGGFGEPPVLKEKSGRAGGINGKSVNCKALGEKWTKTVTGKELSKEENQSRLRELMQAMDLDSKEIH